MATLRKRGDSWQLTWNDAQGQHRKSLGRISEREARQHLKRIEYQLTGGEIITPKHKTPFAEFAKEYLLWHQGTYPDSHRRCGDIFYQYLIPYFKLTPLDAIDIRAGEQYRAMRQAARFRGRSFATSTIIKELQSLKALMNKAVEWGLLGTNLIEKLKYPRDLNSKPKRFYSADELRLLYAAAPENWWVWKFFANTGLRRKELVQLRWADVKARDLHVLSTNQQRTKSGKWRTVPLSVSAKNALEHFDSNAEYVLPRTNPNSIYRAFHRVLNRTSIELPKGSQHCLRHTFISHLVMQGVPLTTVQALAGHADYSTTLGYAHLQPGYLRDAMPDLKL